MCCRFSPLFMSKSPFFGQLPMAKLYACKREAEGQTSARLTCRRILGSPLQLAASCTRPGLAGPRASKGLCLLSSVQSSVLSTQQLSCSHLHKPPSAWLSQ